MISRTVIIPLKTNDKMWGLGGVGVFVPSFLSDISIGWH